MHLTFVNWLKIVNVVILCWIILYSVNWSQALTGPGANAVVPIGEGAVQSSARVSQVPHAELPWCDGVSSTADSYSDHTGAPGTTHESHADLPYQPSQLCYYSPSRLALSGMSFFNLFQ